MGSSWASGIVTLAGQPNLNGRNQESSAEAIHAYEAIALYGRAASDAFKHALSAPLEVRYYLLYCATNATTFSSTRKESFLVEMLW